MIQELRREMEEAAGELEFERAAELRDIIFELEQASFSSRKGKEKHPSINRVAKGEEMNSGKIIIRGAGA